MRDWHAAEQYYSAVANRYRGEEFEWYYFCKRTGHGNKKAAQALAVKRAEQLAKEPNQGARSLAMFNYLEKRPKEALDLFEVVAGDSDPKNFMQIALLSDELKRPDRCEQALHRIVTEGPIFKIQRIGRPRMEVVVLAEALIADRKKGSKADFDIAALEKKCPTDNAPSRACFHYFLGRYLDDHKKGKAAIEQWKKVMACESINLDVRTLAGHALASHSVLPEKYDNPFVPKADAAPAADDDKKGDEKKDEVKDDDVKKDEEKKPAAAPKEKKKKAATKS